MEGKMKVVQMVEMFEWSKCDEIVTQIWTQIGTRLTSENVAKCSRKCSENVRKMYDILMCEKKRKEKYFSLL